MRISDWSSDVCSSDLRPETGALVLHPGLKRIEPARGLSQYQKRGRARCAHSRHGARPEKKPLRRLDLPEPCGSRSMAQQTRSAVFIVADIKKRRPSVNPTIDYRSEEHTSELQSLMRISYAVFCLKKKKEKRTHK